MITLEPPFKADNMDGLFKAVMKGRLRPISKKYSDDLWNIVK